MKPSTATITVKGIEKGAEVIAALVRQGLVLDVIIDNPEDVTIEVRGF